jgi:hypothetical protein
MPEPEADYEIDWDDDNKPVVLPPTPVRTGRMSSSKPAAPAISARDDRDLAEVQAAAASKAARPADGSDVKGGVVATGDTVELLGQKFRIADRIGLMPLLKFASAADVAVQDPRGLAAMYTLLRDCIYAGTPGCGECEHCQSGNDASCASYDRGDWGAFEEHAMVTKADADDLMGVVTEVLEVVSGRPTPPPAGSSPGARPTRRGSTASRSGGRARGSRH